ncbi:MAG: PEP-CTERM/exosortase system-associated acyltransferase [Proteobacteria bacterium]|uniref:PEP-CTERM/exosortase system-associated acyltransferase n=1 Tax=Thauera sp. 2A1 TaxID=2570191 RepID=UPI0012928AF8|nr:PEP-CTERM/exosortase system-associated acyltransferase [Thauera sp. 2A1]KAI5912728.1 PEP-CTERM/exosortase system-associated acyltransferase [Thauera sp. 2A1]MBS0356148.1 PEP-CTERM/exosortase system-associated acyltransferase [Pseudomonadota bacterium]
MINSSKSANLGDAFSKYFEIVPAMYDAQKEAAFRIRHSVYCEDLGWEPARSNGMETDAYDVQSLHCLVRSRSSGEHIGCVRLVRADADDPQVPLPFEQTCADTIDRSIIELDVMSRDRIAEVSRLAIVGQYRRRRGEERTPGTLQDSDFGGGGRSRFPWPLVGLYMGVFAMAEHHGLDTLFLLSEPRLLRHLNKIGITNRQIGGAIEHRGLRAPAVMDVREVIDNLDPLLRSVYQVACEALDGCQNHA